MVVLDKLDVAEGVGEDDDDVLDGNIGTAIFRTGFTVGSMNNLRKLFSTRNNESNIITQKNRKFSNHGCHYCERNWTNCIPSS